MNNKEKMQAVLAICDAVIESVKEAGTLGAPAGVIYSALMSFGCSLEQFNSLIEMLERAGKIRREGNLLFAL